MSGRFYVTTAIDYGNAAPHLGHASEKVYADCAARWHRMQGEDVFFLTGTDENAQKVYKAASEKGKDPQEFVDDTSAEFKRLCKELNVTNDGFQRTTAENHKKAAQHAFKIVRDKDKIYKGNYKGYYCTGCEAFYTADDLEDGCCPTHRAKCDYVEEENYFFKMSMYQDRLLDHFKNCPDFIVPSFRTNEVLNRVKEGLKDISVSRPNSGWGIEVPGDDTHVIYVWFDALVNYLSGIGYPGDTYKNYWPADAHVIGKDIMWFHAVIWPCMLMAMEMELPRHVYVHGFWHSGAKKMSKTTGNVVDPFELVQRYGPDTLRHFLLRETPFGQDGNFSEEALVTRRNTELGNELGNLLQRTLGMLGKYRDGVVPRPGTSGGTDESLLEIASEAPGAMAEAMGRFDFSVALSETWKLIRRANKYVEESEPWTLAKSSDEERLNTVLYNLCECIRLTSVLIEPFLPDTAAGMRNQLGVKEHSGTFNEKCEWGLLKADTVTSPGESLFPKVE